LARQSHRTDIMLERIHRGQDDDSFWIKKGFVANGYLLYLCDCIREHSSRYWYANRKLGKGVRHFHDSPT
jgi:hypothetical protein